MVDSGQVLLISPRKGRWQLPKGRIEAGEDDSAAALREVAEETGVLGRIVAPLPEVRFSYRRADGSRVDKTVAYFLMERDGDLGAFDRREVREVAWLAWTEASRRLTWNNDRRVLDAARQLTGPD